MTVDCVHFNSPCLLEAMPGDAWRLYLPFSVTVYDIDGTSQQLTVPEGFATDLATVPRFPGMFLLFGGKARKSAVLHDWLYSIGRDREFADDVFFAAMRHEESTWRRLCMWLGVRLFGWIYHRQGEALK